MVLLIMYDTKERMSKIIFSKYELDKTFFDSQNIKDTKIYILCLFTLTDVLMFFVYYAKNKKGAFTSPLCLSDPLF